MDIQIDATEAGEEQRAHQPLWGTDTGLIFTQISYFIPQILRYIWIVIANDKESIKHNRCTATDKLQAGPDHVHQIRSLLIVFDQIIECVNF